MDDAGILKYVWQGALTIMMAVIAYFSKRTIETLDQVEDKTNSNELELAKYKTEVAKEYAKESTMQESLARVHDRMDDLYHLNNEIKNILINKKDS